MSERDAFDRVLVSLHKATLDDAHWATAFALIDETCGTKGNFLIHGEGNSRTSTRIFLKRFVNRGRRREDWEHRYFRDYYPRDERIPRLMHLADSQMVHVSDLFTEYELKTSANYNELLPDCQAQNSLHVRLDGPNGSRIVWAPCDPVDGDGWTATRTKMLRRLLPHLRQHAVVRQALAEAGALGATVGSLLQQNRIGIIQLDARARIVATTDCAAEFLRQGGCLFDKDGFLHARFPRDNAVLQQLLARALPSVGAPGAGGSMAVRGSSVVPGLVVHASPVGQDDADLDAFRIAALVLVAEPAGLKRVDPAPLMTTLGLTPTESRVAALLAEGRTVRDIARTLARSENTIRWHVRQIYDKHGISREVELVRLVLSVSGPSGHASGQ